LPIPRFPVYLFDVDGTLVDSAQDICAAVQAVLQARGRTDVSNDHIRSHIGKHLLSLFGELFPDLPLSEFDAMVQEYRKVYLGRNHESTSVYPGVHDALQRLPGRKSTATTKGTPTTRMVLERFQLMPFFHHVQGTDGFPAKPYPDVIFAALRGLDAQPEDCLFVGDSSADMEAAQRAGVRCCAVTYGYGDPDELRRWNPDFLISDMRELAD
jgi:phosphoglycolate phosphatase